MNQNTLQTSARGFTLIELLVTVAVLGILITAGLPQLSTYLKNSRLTTQTNNFVAVLNYARGEAITAGNNVFLTALNANNDNNEWGNGWLLWVDGLQTSACETGSKPNAPNRTLEQEDAGCNEVLKIFDFNDSSVTIDFDGDLSEIGKAQVETALKAKTLMFRGGEGTLALTGSTINFADFYVCDNRTDELGRHIRINRNTGRVALFDSAYSDCND